MTTPTFFSFRTIVEEKVTAYLISKMPGLTIVKGVTDEIRVIPTVICHAENASAIQDLGANTLGNYQVNLKVYVFSSADDETNDQHRARVIEVMNNLRDLPALQALWEPEEGLLYNIYVTADDEDMKQRRYGNLIEYTVWGMLPPAP